MRLQVSISKHCPVVLEKGTGGMYVALLVSVSGDEPWVARACMKQALNYAIGRLQEALRDVENGLMATQEEHYEAKCYWEEEGKGDGQEG